MTMTSTMTCPTRHNTLHQHCREYGLHDPHIWYVNAGTLDLLFNARWCDGR